MNINSALFYNEIFYENLLKLLLYTAGTYVYIDKVGWSKEDVLCKSFFQSPINGFDKKDFN